MLRFQRGVMIAFVAALSASCFAVSPSLWAAEPSPDERHAAEQFFETKVRPILIDNCTKCHGQEKQKANLRLDTLHGLLTGGDSGPALVPGDVEHSLLMQVVSYSDDYVQMPPSKKLADAQIAALARWVKLGAPWPGASKEAAAAQPPKRAKEITDEDRRWWAFQPVRRPVAPSVKQKDWAASPIDAFVLSQLEAKGIAPNDRASKLQLLRRAYFDLIGLPPKPDEVERFLKDSSPEAFARVIDDLLARPQYGERWARHWLDLVRYAQTSGYERDNEKPYAWRYRDYVIAAFNADKPYDRFVVEQLAGDELDPVTDESLIATGFYHLGVWDDEPDDARMAEFDGLDDTLVATSAAFLGLTVGCARCHDHKFDPILQDDYYRLLSFVRNVRSYDGGNTSEASAAFLPLGDRAAIARRFADAEAKVKPLLEELKKANKKDKKELQAEIDRIRRETAGPVEWALAVRDGAPKPTHVLIRGNAGTPGDEVQPGFLSVLASQSTGSPAVAINPPVHGSSTGRRLALARWIASPEHPLTARVMANRIWQHHFGRGIVKTTADFGRGGILPTHPQLLDWLAAEFVESGWSIKHLHKAIMLSATYQLSSRSNNDAGQAKDPANDLFWRQNLRRLDAEAIRDSILAVSGELNPAMGGRGFFPHMAGEVLAGGSRPGGGWEISSAKEQARRSIYAFIKRSMVPPIFEGFDYANTAAPLGERPVTTVAPQALLLLNDQFMQEQARAFAARLAGESSDDLAEQVARAYELALARRPTDAETRVALAYLQRQTQAQQSLRARLTFAPDVPISLHNSYLNRLQPADYLLGPREGWSYHRGRWQGGYEGIMTVDRDRGPFALWQGPTFSDGVIEAQLTLQKAVEFGAVLFRATAEGDVFRGYEVAFSPRDQAVALRRLGAETTLLSEIEMDVPTGVPTPIKIEAVGPRIRVWMGDRSEPVIDVTDPQPLQDAGRVGARSWGAATSLDQLAVTTGGKRFDVATTPVVAGGQPISAPPAGWRHYGGVWSLENDAYAVEPAPGAKAIWETATIGDGVVDADVMLRADKGDGGLVVRVTQPSDGVDALAAYNVNFQAGALRLGKHQNNWRELVRVPFKFGVGQWHHVRVELVGPRVKVFVDGAAEPQIDYTDERPLPPGNVGVRTFNAKMAVKDLKVTTGGKTIAASFKPLKLEPAIPPTNVAVESAQQQAMASLCLMILNLNEFVYID